MARLFTKEQHDYLVSFQVGKTAKEVAEMMNEKYGLSLTPLQIKNYKRNNGLKSGLDGRFQKGNIPFNKGKKFPNTPPNSGQFQKGNKPHGWVPVGTIRYTTDGYPRVKVADPDKWEFCHRKEWERHYGPIPKGHGIAFLNGDKTNWNISNLVLLSNNEVIRMNSNHYFTPDAELTRSGIGVVKLNNKLKELKEDRQSVNNNK